MPDTYEVGAVRGVEELEQILALQRKNLKQHVSAEEARSEGFVTVEHDLRALRRMHALAPSIVARHEGVIVGYALTMPRECRDLLPVLVPMFDLLERLDFQGRPLSARRFYVMGQVCVDKAHRGRGVFDSLFATHRDLYRERYDMLVTEVSTSNPRSQRAHERVGFVPVHTYRDATDEWVVSLWNWDESPRR
ncbi:GNAT family N-acetyltransferase [Myxococcus stipitatus]|uniref:GNAT family N-acetyltransferase n=1 Tax=Myxococcus stipitatus TaxID=83455 RepID=UPI0030CC5572